MRALLVQHSDGVGFLVDRDADGVSAVYVAYIPSLPEKYLPKTTAFHDETLRPQWQVSPQNFLLGEDWDGQLLAKVERAYLNVYAFNYWMAVGSTEQQQPSHILNYIYDGGFPIMHAFNHMRAAVPRSQRARAAGVSANSPGVFTMNAPSGTANRVVESMSRLVTAETEYGHAYDNVHQWSRLRPQKAGEVAVAAAIDQLQRLCARLSIDDARLLPAIRSTTVEAVDSTEVLVAGKLIASYYRQLWSLFSPDRGVEFLGPKPANGSRSYDSDEDEDDTIS
jgi:hypothetical protein